MTEIIKPGAGILFMKVGTHAGETLAEIIDRKSREIEKAGFAMWGYGGNTCHPRTIVQPFADMFTDRSQPIFLCMQKMNSNHFAEPLRAHEYSSDGLSWTKVPDAINVLGSRFALIIKGLRQEEHILSLTQTRVAVGNSQGRAGSRYVQGHVDKACLIITDRPEPANGVEQSEVSINLVAELAKPFAVFLREHG